MTKVRPSDLLRAARPGAEEIEGPVDVLLALRVAKPDEPLLVRLRNLGLTIRTTVGNKLVGSIDGEHLAALRADPDVADVEISRKLHPH
jgi:hypothetical protein